MCKSFIPRGLEINGSTILRLLRARHPHREHKSEAGEVVPQGRQIKDAKLIAWNFHRRVADDERCVVVLEHGPEVGPRDLPLWFKSKKLAKDDLHQRD